MGTLRKLQLEIDRTLKKVTEGLQIFDDYLDQLQGTDNTNQKEKHEANLKTEIKKLQRYRDQVKTWIAGGEIKDKEALTTARKDIERRMEQFKVCEKEAKTKAYSREGLGAASRLDPRDRARQEMREWLVATVEALTTALEECEAELEELGPTGRPKKGKVPPRTARLEETCSRHRAHVARCEQLLRLLDNEGVGAEELEAVKDSVDDYLARGSESWDEFADPDDAY
ncbi:Not1 protein of CCR4-Not complex component, partial [Helicosporidium sp. ATCC 50920]